MTNGERNARWRERYGREVANMTSRYEKINAQAKTIIHKATPEETEKYMAMARKPKPYLTLRGV